MLKKAFFATVYAAVIAAPLAANAFELKAEAYVVGDPESGRLLLTHNSASILQPASLTKMMTLYMLFSALERGELTLESDILVSEKAWKTGGSKMFIEVGKMAKVEDLIKGITVSSGNDACIAVAERLGGTEEAFAQMMTTKGQEIGLKNTVFLNASGWPMEGHVTTPEDMFTLSRALVRDFPQYYHYFSLRSFTYSGITQPNRNGLLRRNVGVDGLKTGHTEESGYHLVASAERDGQRFMAVIMGTNSMKAREAEALKGLSWAFGRYKTYNITTEGEEFTQAPVRYGQAEMVPAVAAETGRWLLSFDQHQEMQKTITLNPIIQAPLKKGDQIGTVTFTTKDLPEKTVSLVAGADVPEKDFFAKILEMAKRAVLN